MAKGDDIQERLINFAVQIIKTSSDLSKSFVGNHIAKQILRSGTSAGANYGEARGAESKRDFVHKLGLVLKELNETLFWLEILRNCKLLNISRINALLCECDELAKIISVSIRTTNKTINRNL